ncbi:pyridoxamine 5'-phosphate oxidase family protein [Actinomadura keratinilytica]|jgi:PPOX class probable F420-dependent enzyme|uniref:TIGR03618 family F420-dependent PPOX class oxidoreductase n=1 Tax=Actinomadura keratinilytica TaxID=547461 RepID=A0ABP7Y4I7_9ACTN
MTGGYSPGTGPGPKKPTDEELSRLLGEHRFGALATNKSNGHPALSTVLYHWDPQERVLRFSTTADRLKVRHVRNDPRVALYVTSADHMTYVVAEGVAEASPVSERPGDGTGRELLAIYPAELSPADQAVFLENMVKDRRLVVRIRVTRLYGLTVGG